MYHPWHEIDRVRLAAEDAILVEDDMAAVSGYFKR
jgi:hypothetical protein